MTEEELREKIANELKIEGFFQRPEYVEISHSEMAWAILTLIKQAGYLNRTEVQTMLDTLSGGLPDLLKELGWVQLAKDQGLPGAPKFISIPNQLKGYKQAQENMLKAGFRRIEP